MEHRRTTDGLDSIERIVALETNMTHVKEVVEDFSGTLKQHMSDETHNDARINIALERHGAALQEISSAVKTIAEQNTRVHSLEEFRTRAEKQLDQCAVSSQRTEFIYKLAAALATLASAAWAVLTFIFK